MDKLELNLPRFHSEFELKNRIEYLKWLILLSTVGLSTSAGLYKYFEVKSEWLMGLYLLGWTCLTICIWIGFQVVHMMAATNIFQVDKKTRKLATKVIQKELKEGKSKEWVPILPFVFKMVNSQMDITVYLFMSGYGFLAIAIFYPIVVSNPFKFVVAIPVLIFIFWFGFTNQKKTN